MGAAADASVDELDLYLSEPLWDKETEPLDAWRDVLCKKFPTLALVAARYLSISATSAKSERVFSAAGFILNHLRSTLAPELFSDIMFIRENLDLSPDPWIQKLFTNKREAFMASDTEAVYEVVRADPLQFSDFRESAQDRQYVAFLAQLAASEEIEAGEFGAGLAAAAAAGASGGGARIAPANSGTATGETAA